MNQSILLALGLLMAVPTFAAEKFGVVKMQEAILKTKAGKEARKNIESEIAKKKKDIEKLRSDFTKMQKDFESKSVAWSDDMKAKKGAELQREAMKIQETMYKNQQELQAKEMKLKGPIIDDLRKAIEQVASKGKYSVIFEGAEDKVLFVAKANDVTDEVVEAFEKINKK